MKHRVPVYVALVAILLLSAALPAAGAGQSTAVSTAWNATIAVVWPHDGAGHGTGVAGSRAVNISVWPRDQVSCSDAPPATPLWAARNNEPADAIRSDGQFTSRFSNGVSFPSLEYNDVGANIVDSPGSQYRFFLTPGSSNVWVHAADARTYLPQPFEPWGYSNGWPGEVDARIQIVFPHSGSTRVNVAVDLFEHGTHNSVPADYTPPGGLLLWTAEGNGRPSSTGLPVKEFYSVNGQGYPRWVFNNVPVQPGLQYNFIATVAGANTHPTVWTHARDPRTFLPNPQPPAGCTTGPVAGCVGTLNEREQRIAAAVPTMGCPAGPERTLSMARQSFQFGQMIWRSDGPTIYVLYNDGGWQSFVDAWRDGMPSSDPALLPPPGLLQPLRGFGKVWREQLGGPAARLGWATNDEAGMDGGFEVWQGGFSFRFGGEILVLVHGGSWRTL